jgi:iron-sulfur cluster repair protein YtfE (RIC family)
MELKHSEIRTIILGEHQQLRQQMQALQATLEKSPSGLGPALQAFLGDFLRHIAHEEVLLRPVLAQVDAWARQRVDAMDVEHAEQRERLQALALVDPAQDPQAFVGRVQETLEWIRLDMAGEEKSLLSPDLLRDDIIVLDTFGG